LCVTCVDVAIDTIVNERLGVLPSEFCDDSESIHSTTDVSETASQDDFINSQGVRFMPHTYIKEGMYIHTCIKILKVF
jgi:hypothetical protein